MVCNKTRQFLTVYFILVNTNQTLKEHKNMFNNTHTQNKNVDEKQYKSRNREPTVLLNTLCRFQKHKSAVAINHNLELLLRMAYGNQMPKVITQESTDITELPNVAVGLIYCPVILCVDQ